MFRRVKILVGRRHFWKRVLIICLCGFLLYLARLMIYIFNEYILRTHLYISPQQKRTVGTIPRHIHQVFLFETSQQVPDKLSQAQKTCIEENPSFKYTFWNKTMVDRLVDTHYPELKELYYSYDHWVKRADVARYLVLHHMGGWYLDMDIRCKRSLDELEERAIAGKYSVVFRYTDPWGISNDFIGITQQHPFLTDTLKALPYSYKWYIVPYASTIFSTGPMFLWGRQMNYPVAEDFLVIENYKRYLHLLHSSSWHSLDGILIWYFFRYSSEFWILLACLSTLFSVLSYISQNSEYSLTWGKRVLKLFS